MATESRPRNASASVSPSPPRSAPRRPPSRSARLALSREPAALRRGHPRLRHRRRPRVRRPRPDPPARPKGVDPQPPRRHRTGPSHAARKLHQAPLLLAPRHGDLRQRPAHERRRLLAAPAAARRAGVPPGSHRRVRNRHGGSHGAARRVVDGRRGARHPPRHDARDDGDRLEDALRCGGRGGSRRDLAGVRHGDPRDREAIPPAGEDRRLDPHARQSTLHARRADARRSRRARASPSAARIPATAATCSRCSCTPRTRTTAAG